MRYGRQIQFATVYLGPIQTPMWEGRRHWLVPAPEKVAQVLASFIVSHKLTLYCPFISTLLLRLSLFLPDKLFASLSSKMLK